MMKNRSSSGLWKKLYIPEFNLTTDGIIGCVQQVIAGAKGCGTNVVMHAHTPTQSYDVLTQCVSSPDSISQLVLWTSHSEHW